MRERHPPAVDQQDAGRAGGSPLHSWRDPRRLREDKDQSRDGIEVGGRVQEAEAQERLRVRPPSHPPSEAQQAVAASI